MFEDLKKSIDKGLDYAFMNAEKLAQSAKELAQEHKLNKEEAKKLFDYLQTKSEETKKSVEAELQVLVKNVMKKMEIPLQEDITRLEERIRELEGARKKTTKAKPAPKEAKTPRAKTKK
ncbi:MAG: hypothetical protein WCO44_03005 [Bacteroidota bacterium]